MPDTDHYSHAHGKVGAPDRRGFSTLWRMRVSRCISVVACCLLASCSTDVSIVESGGPSSDIGDGTVSWNSRFFDSDSSDEYASQSWPIFHDMQEFAESSDVVFVGNLTGFAPDIAVDNGDSEKQPDGGPIIIYDALQFEIEDVIHGELTDSEDGFVSVAHPAGYYPMEGEPFLLVTLPPIDVFRPSFERSQGSDSGSGDTKFIVFAQRAEFSGEWFYVFAGPGSVAAVEPDGRIIESGQPPFVNLSGILNDFGEDMTVAHVSNWIRNGPPPPRIDESMWPTVEDMPDAAPLEPVGDASG